VDQFGEPRRTEIVGYSGNIRMEDVVPDDPMVVTMSKAGYIKRTDLVPTAAKNGAARASWA